LDEELDLSWLKLPDFDKLKLEERARIDSYFRENFHKDLTDTIIQKLKFQEENEQNIIIDCYGEPGSGKSYTAIYLAWLMAKIGKKRFTADTIFFRLDDINAYLPNLEWGSKIVVDERVPVFGTGAKRLDQQYILMMETLRKKQVSFFIVAPLPRAVEYAHFLVHSLRLTDFKTLNIVEIQTNEFDCLGHMVIPNPSKFDKNLIEEYERKKDAFLESVRLAKKEDYLSAYTNEVMNSEEFLRAESIFKSESIEKKRKFRGIPKGILLEIINAKFPELRRNIEAKTISEQIRQRKIISGEWAV
jgi:hypothetical protein